MDMQKIRKFHCGVFLQHPDLKKKRDCTIRVAKTKALISFSVTAKLICVFVFAYADYCFSGAVAHFCIIRCAFIIME